MRGMSKDGGYGGDAKRLTGEYYSLDVRQLQREGMLRQGQTSDYHWYMKGKSVASVGLSVEMDRIIVFYVRHDANKALVVERYPILLKGVDCNYGGQRVWFACPAGGCGREVAILYLNGVFACRYCHRLSYLSQRQKAWERATERARAVRLSVGGSVSLFDPFPARPKGMHFKTYQELRSKYADAKMRAMPDEFPGLRATSRVRS